MFPNDIDLIQIDDKKYKLNYMIGQGGAGVVYHVTDQKGQPFAIKMIRNYKNSMIREMVNTQIKVQKMFKGQKFVISCYGQKYQFFKISFRVISNNIYILMQLGEYSLRNKIQINHLIQNQYIQMLIDVSNGLRLIHQKKIIHRDIKPQNVIYSKGIFKITDFGTSIENQKSNQIAGTCLYWAPELLYDSEQQYTQAVDIWSFGVLAFQAYFLIHPFCYNKQKIKSRAEAIVQIKKNIQALTPAFTFGKLAGHLRKLGYGDKADFIDKKLQQSQPELINIFKDFFAIDPKNRIQLDLLMAKFQSIQLYQFTKQVPKVELLVKQKPPSDVNIFIEALNYFYKLDHDFTCKMHQEVELHLQLGTFIQFISIGLKIICFQEHKKKCYIKYCNQKKLEKIKIQQSTSVQNYSKIRAVLSEYYFYLRQSKQILFFQQLPKLRMLVCFCSCWLLIRKDFKTFIKRVQQIIHMPLRSLNQFEQMLLMDALTQKHLSNIQNLILSNYFGS